MSVVMSSETKVYNLLTLNIPEGASLNSKTTVFVGPGSPWENPFEEGPDGTIEDINHKFLNLLKHTPGIETKIKNDLAGKNLSCHCGHDKCHAHILRDIAAGDLLIRETTKPKKTGRLFQDFC